MERSTMATQLAVTALVLAGIGSTGCYAKKKDVREEFARVRSEMQTGDQQLGAQISDTQTRLGAVSGRVDAIEQNVQKMQTELSDLNVKVTRLNGLIAFDVPVHFDFISTRCATRMRLFSSSSRPSSRNSILARSSRPKGTRTRRAATITTCILARSGRTRSAAS